MKIRYVLLTLMVIASPALAKNYSAHGNGKKVVGCMPSTDPNVPPCGIKDEAPTYFPEKLATPAKPAVTTPAAPAAEGKKTKHKKPKPEAAPAATSEPEEGWERPTKDTNAETY